MTNLHVTDAFGPFPLLCPVYIDSRHACEYIRSHGGDHSFMPLEHTIHLNPKTATEARNRSKELEAYRELEAAVRELESSAANVAMPMIRDRIRAALAALDRARR